jgi:hypothetical protein
MADASQLTTDQHNFCLAVEAMKLDLLRSGKQAAWLVAYPGVLPTHLGPGRWPTLRAAGGGDERLPAGLILSEPAPAGS